MMTDKCYDLLCVVQRWLTAAGVLYLAISAIWGLPYGDEINQSIVAVCAFLAAIIEIQKSQWNKTHTITIENFDCWEDHEK